MIAGFGVPELLIIFVIVLLLFGGPKLAELAKGMGDSVRHFKTAVRESKDAEKELKK